MSRPARFAVVMAGGAGTRFWPRSRRRFPKQLLPIVTPRSMLQDTVDRARTLVPVERIMVVTTSELRAAVHRQLPDLPRGNVIGEPVGRNTAACIGLAAVRVAQDDPDATMIVLPADHLVNNAPAFRKAVRTAARLGDAGHLVTIGITPAGPETGYGYIECARAVAGYGRDASWAASFTEKPTRGRAERFLASGRYLWNSGIFAWQARVILAQIDAHIPRLGRGLAALRGGLGGRREAALLRRVYPSLPATSIDYGILERAERVAVVRGRFGWSDVGSWAAMEHIWGKTARGGNAVQGRAVAVHARGCVVSSPQRLVALCGVEDLIVVDAPDALLVCHKSRAQDIRLVVQELKRRGLKHLL
jgi:mannose-1-phosphate guanylyltransferase